ncbi:MAG: hypothetical protein R6U28_05050 [Cyclonatronaceae bacterium]
MAAQRTHRMKKLSHRIFRRRTLSVIFMALFFGILLAGSPAAAQVTVSLNVDPNPNPRIADWVNRTELAILTVNNTNPRLEGLEYRIQVKVLQDGRPVVETRPSRVRPQRLELGSQVFLADEIITYEALNFAGGTERKIVQTGMLPAGFYSFCVSLTDLRGQVISTPEEVCRPMRVTSYQAPELVYPSAEMQLSSRALASTQFTWTPITPAPPAEMGVKYILTVTEIRPPQSPSQAFFVNYPVIEEEVIGTTSMLWPPEIEPPSENTFYAWSVKAVTMDDEPYVEDNAGFATVRTFQVTVPDDSGEDEEAAPKSGEDDPPEEEEEDEPVDPGILAVSDTLYAGQDGEFEIIVTEATQTGQAFTGKGTAYIGWLMARMAVEFDSITVDLDKRLVDGKIIVETHEDAPVYPVDWALEVTAQANFTNNAANSVVDWVENTSGQTIPYNNLTEYTTPVKMPLGLTFPDGNEAAITEMAFRSNKSEFNVIAAKTVPASWGTSRIGFRGKNILFHPTSIQLPAGRFELVEDITMGNVNNQIQFVFKQPGQNNLGCYIEWDEDGFSEYGLELQALFTRDWLIPSPDTDPNKKAAASISANGTSWTDLILGGTLERSEIVGASGMTILADSIFYDFSDVLNPPGITFPENYQGETSELFRGFYMSALEVELPETWQTHAGGQPKIGVYDMIIDDMGLTMKANATNVVQFPDADVADLVASIDTVHVDMVAGSLTEAGLNGRIGLPVSDKDDLDNPLVYAALFNNPQDPNEPVNFQLTVTPTGPIPASLLKGELELSETSNIVAYVDPDKRTFDIDLNGDFSWGSVDLGPVKNVNLALGFQGLGMNYDSSEQNSFSFSIGSWSFASEQKFLANFPVTIDNIGFTTLPVQQNQLIRGKVGLDVIFNLSEEIGGMTGLGVEMAILDNVQDQKFYPQYLSTSLDSIAVQANLSAVSIEGAIGFRNEDPVFGNGFIGTLSADFKPAGIQASALAEFGNTAYQNGNELYRYWRVEADVTLPPPGVVFLPGLAFRGFGGGAYYNMEASLSGSSYSFMPLKSQLGFQAKATMATTPSEDGFNADAVLAGEFNTSTGGLTFINFTGDFWVGAELSASSRAEAIVDGNLGVTYNFPDKHFNLFANVNVDAPPIGTPSPVSLVLDIDGKQNQWYFKFGEPANPNTVSVFGLNLYSYLMFGNHINPPTGFTPGFSNAYYNAVHQYPGTSQIGSGGVGSHTNTGSGFALGIGFMFDHSAELPLSCGLCAGDFYAGFNLGAGAELHLAFLDYAGGCSGYNPIGINGWRANGGLGFYGTASAYVRREGGLGNKTWSIVDLAAGAWIYGEFPNPYYAAGAVSGHAYVFKVINVNFHHSFEVGATCGNQASGSSVTVTPGDVAADQQEKLVQYINPSLTYNYPVDEPLAVKYGLEPDEVFDVAEQQADGTIEMRTFKMEKTATLEVQDENGSWSTQTLNNTTNILGEYLYTTIGEANMINPGLDFAQPPVMGGNTGTGGTGGTGATGSGPNQGGAATFMDPSLGMSGSVIASFMGLGGASGTGPGSGPGNMPAMDDMSINPLLPYPPEPPQPDYGDLPPPPTPPTNNLEDDRPYRLTVSATLREYVNGSWTTAQTRSGTPVTETVVKTFRTGPIPPVAPSQQLPSQTF